MAILTLSRLFGAGGREIGHTIAGSLGYQYIDKQTILSDMRSVGPKWEAWGRDLDESGPSVWEKYDWSFKGFAAIIASIFLDRALNDKVVLMGRGGNFLLEGIPHAHRILVLASMESRIERIITRETVDTETARWLVEKTDHEREGFVYSLYGKQLQAPESYDEVIDTGSKSTEEIAESVKEQLLAKDLLNTQEARNILRMRAIAARVRLRLVADPNLSVPTLEVEVEGDQLVLRGIVRSPRQRNRIDEAARKLAGDVPLICRLHYRG
jgi:hypothetical protein